MADYLKLHAAGDPYCSDGLVAWNHSWWDTEAPIGFRRYREQVRLAAAADGKLRAERIISAGGTQEHSPVIAKDGTVYFLSDASMRTPWPEDGTVPQYLANELFLQQQIYRWKEGQVEQLTAMRHGVIRYALSPDEKKIFFLSYQYETDAETDLLRERTTEERERILEERLTQPFVTEKQSYKSDAEMGYRSVRDETLWVKDGNALRCILHAAADFASPCWMPDSQHILFQRTNEEEKLEFCTVEIESGQQETLAVVENVELCYETDFTPIVDTIREQIIFAANRPGMEYAEPRRLYAIPLAGGRLRQARRLLSPENDIDGVLPQDMNFASRGYQEEEFVLMPNGRCYYTTGMEGDVKIASVDVMAEDDPPQILTGDMENFHALRMFDAAHLLVLYSSAVRPPELALVNIDTGRCKALTNSNPWLDEVLIRTPSSIWTEDGIHGFYLPPVMQTENNPKQEKTDMRDSTQKKAPVILYCHGGPTGFYCSAFNLEMQALAAAGFGVLYPNPRGGTGYGVQHGLDALAYDGSALADVITFTDTVCRQFPELDPARVGICGGSYGGYLTLMAAAKSDRFRAASAHRALANMQMISASSHSAGGHSREEFPEFLDKMREEIKTSPASYADQIHIPLQILQSSLDANCVPEQADQLYTAMRLWNPKIPCEYIRYPDSCHGLGHRGPMELAVHHRNACMRFMKEYL